MRVTAILKGKPDAHGKKTVYIRTNIGKVRKFRATKIKVLPAQWDSDNMKVKPSHPQAAHYNQTIKKKILEKELSEVNGDVIDTDIDFSKYCESCFNLWRGQKRESTLRIYRGDMNKLIEFRQGLKVSQLSPRLLELYKKHLLDNDYSFNTTWRIFKFMRTIVRKAIKDKIIKDDPFIMFEMPKYSNPKTFYLTQKEVDEIEKYSIDPGTKKYLAFLSKWFVIGCYTGLRYKDMYLFNRDEHIKNGRLVLYTDKTGSLVSIKLSERLIELLERVEYKNLNWQNEPSNRALKIVQKDCKIKTLLKWHVARHTFGVRCADAGISIEVAAKLMGHSKTETTAIYYKITNKRLDNEVAALFD